MSKMILRFHPWMEVLKLRLFKRSGKSSGSKFVKTEPQKGDKIFVSRRTPPSIRIWRGDEKASLYWGGICRVQDNSEFCRRNRIDHEPLELEGFPAKTFRFAGLHYLDFGWPKDSPISDEDLAAHALASVFPGFVFTLEKRSKDMDPIMPNGVVYIKDVKPKSKSPL